MSSKVTYFVPKKRSLDASNGVPSATTATSSSSLLSPSDAVTQSNSSSSLLLPGSSLSQSSSLLPSFSSPSKNTLLTHSGGNASPQQFTLPPSMESTSISSESVSTEAHRLLKQVFGFQNFRGPQLQVIESLLQGRDNLLVMATGAGKSLCYQLPPLLKRQTAVVVSPLVSLMHDQVMALEARGIAAVSLHGGAAADAFEKASKGQTSVIFVTPEGLPNRLGAIQRLHQAHGVCLVAIDEAHCVSEWGHDFRPDYRNLSILRSHLPGVPVLAVTATATDVVCNDIVTNLQLCNPMVIKLSFDRHNLFYDVRPRAQLRRDLPAICQEHEKRKESMLVYCSTVKEVEDIANDLELSGVKACRYHASLSDGERKLSHVSFQRDDVYIVVATVAFGMGIDKANIRTVVHASCPKSVEQYYQETGRAGRDGLQAQCILFGSANTGMLEFYCKDAQSTEQKQSITTKLMTIKKYCELGPGQCRRKFILQYFGETYAATNCGACDNCTSQAAVRDFTDDAILLLEAVKSTGQRLGLLKPIDVLRGSKAAGMQPFLQLPVHGKGAGKSKTWWKALALAMQQGDRFLKEETRTMFDGSTYVATVLGSEANAVLQGEMRVILPLPKVMAEEEEEDARRLVLQREAEHLRNIGGQSNVALYDTLKEVRKVVAGRIGDGLAPELVFDDPTLERITKARPSSLESLCSVEGVSELNGQHYGADFLTQIAAYCSEHNLAHDTHLSKPPRLSEGNKCRPQPPLPADMVGQVIAKYSRGIKSHMESYELFVNGKLSIEQIAEHRGVKPGTIVGHLATAIADGYPLELSSLGVSDEKIALITEKVVELGDAKLSPIKEALPEDITWDDLRLVMAKMKADDLPNKRQRTS